MATIFRLAGVESGSVDPGTADINFLVQVEDGRKLAFVASAAVAEQIASALGGMSQQLRQSSPQAVNAEDIAQYGVQRDAYGGPVLLRLVTRGGIPHMFAVPLAAASDIAARLKTESEKDRKPGHA